MILNYQIHCKSKRIRRCFHYNKMKESLILAISLLSVAVVNTQKVYAEYVASKADVNEMIAIVKSFKIKVL